MANKSKKQEEKVNRLSEFFFSEHKFWDILGLFSGIFATLIGFMLLFTDSLYIDSSVFIIGQYSTVFAWMVFMLGIVMLIMIGWPFYEPSIPELKKVTYPSKAKLLNHTIRTFGFMAFFLAMLILMDMLIGLTPLAV